jgi:hypothetical protein
MLALTGAADKIFDFELSVGSSHYLFLLPLA